MTEKLGSLDLHQFVLVVNNFAINNIFYFIMDPLNLQLKNIAEQNLNHCGDLITSLNPQNLYNFGWNAKIIQNKHLQLNNTQFTEAGIKQIIKSMICLLNDKNFMSQGLLIGKKIIKQEEEMIGNRLLNELYDKKKIDETRRKNINHKNRIPIYSYRFQQGYNLNKLQKQVFKLKIEKYVKNNIKTFEQIKQINDYIKIQFVPIHGKHNQALIKQYVIRIRLQKKTKYLFYQPISKKQIQTFTFKGNQYQKVQGSKIYKMIHEKYYHEQKIVNKPKRLQHLVIQEQQDLQKFPNDTHFMINKTIETHGQQERKHQKFLIFCSREKLKKNFAKKKIHAKILQLLVQKEQSQKENLYFYYIHSKDEKNNHNILKKINEEIKYDKVSEILKIQGKNKHPNLIINKIARILDIKQPNYRTEKLSNNDINHYFDFKNQQHAASVALYLRNMNQNYQFFKREKLSQIN